MYLLYHLCMPTSTNRQKGQGKPIFSPNQTTYARYLPNYLSKKLFLNEYEYVELVHNCNFSQAFDNYKWRSHLQPYYFKSKVKFIKLQILKSRF